ncbi:MAG: ABC transporter ATP-binding protein [Bifidobacteriaceae bacterium]|jgi:peptide/nickel transport system ATP-binding protein|nr:ABC transporter ATP-binding protein [Bifidobacteriaceae bacterium]
MTALHVAGLTVSLGGREILHGVSLRAPARSCLAVVGESGSGKSMTAKALAGLLPPGANVAGSYRLGGEEIDLAARDRAWRRIRGKAVVWLPQDPFTSLDPLRRCGPQLAPPGTRRPGRAERRARAAAALAEVGLEAEVADAYPHELSGGMRQRVAIAAALAPGPAVLIADEPTTALDAHNQREVLDLLDALRESRRMTLVLITHDLEIARRRAGRLAVFQGGRVVEAGPTEHVLAAPAADHTRELLAAALPRLRPVSDAVPQVASGAARVAVAGARTVAAPDVVQADGLAKTYPGAARPALVDASIRIAAGEVVGVVGESGSGKTTLARLLLGLERPDAGSVRWWDGIGQERGWGARLGQLVFQNPYASLNPTLTVRATLKEALRATGGTPERADELMRLAGLDQALADRKPAKLSGGERQRAAIARALAPAPRLLVADEAVSALDAAVRAQVLDTFDALRSELGMAVLFVSHDLAAVARLADRVLVMRQGRIVEAGPTGQIVREPAHEYTKLLVGADA